MSRCRWEQWMKRIDLTGGVAGQSHTRSRGEFSGIFAMIDHMQRAHSERNKQESSA
jgi:hypothetical protein